MADRIGKLCDDCLERGQETVIGTVERPVIYTVVGTYTSGLIPDAATLPRFAWEIFADYNERTDCLVQLNLTRAELCGSCWIARLSQPSALEELSGTQYCAERKMAYILAHPPAPEPEPPEPDSEEETIDDDGPSLNSPIQAEREKAAAILQAKHDEARAEGGDDGS